MIGARLKILRNKKGLTQKELASALSTSQSYICSLEQDRQVPGGEILLSLKRFFDIDLDWLLTGEEDIAPQSHVSGDTPEIAELLEGARNVLTSGNPIAFDALERNIRYFSHAIDVEKRMLGMESDLAEMKSYVMEIKRQEEARDKARKEEQSSGQKAA